MLKLRDRIKEWRDKAFQWWHFRVGPTAEQVMEARQVLAGRRYYQLYDDVWRELSRVGSPEREQLAAQSRSTVHRTFEQLRGEGLVPGPGASLIDLGCGGGHNAVWFAQLGYLVTGADVSPAAIHAATCLATERGVTVDFRVADVTELAGFQDRSFDLATDIGCLHMLVGEEHRRCYLRSVHRVLRRGGAFFLFNNVASRDVVVADEEAYILRSITCIRQRWTTSDGGRLSCRGCGFRNASLRQYRAELEASGFEVVRAQRGRRGRDRAFATILARVP